MPDVAKIILPFELISFSKRSITPIQQIVKLCRFCFEPIHNGGSIDYPAFCIDNFLQERQNTYTAYIEFCRFSFEPIHA